MKSNEARDLIGCCGLYCGLCNKYQSKAPSRCIGCKRGEQHSWCSIWNCCVKKHKVETCSECNELFYCPIFVRRKVVEWIPAFDNLHQMKESGLETWLNEQEERQVLLEELLRNFNEGRSMTFYCKVCARMPVNLIYNALDVAKGKLAGEKHDLKVKARTLKEIIRDSALKESINL